MQDGGVGGVTLTPNIDPPQCMLVDRAVMLHAHPSSVMFLRSTIPSICHQTYIHTSKGHVIWFIKKVNRIPTHCRVAYKSIFSLARGHMIRVWLGAVPNVASSATALWASSFALNFSCPANQCKPVKSSILIMWTHTMCSHV